MYSTAMLLETVRLCLELSADYPVFKYAAKKARKAVGTPEMSEAQREELGTRIEETIREMGLFKQYVKERKVPYTGGEFVAQRKMYCEAFLSSLRTR